MVVSILGGAAGILFLTVLAIWVLGERGRWILPATRSALQRYGYWRLLTPRGAHLYIYGCWPSRYIGLLIKRVAPCLGRRGKRYVADHYHGKIVTTEQARAIITIDRAIPLRDLEQIVPYPVARDLVLNGPPDVAVLKCPCRQASPNPCQPMDVCLIVGQPFVDLVLDHHPRTSRRATQAEALRILDAEHRRGHLHSAWFKDACLNRFFAICNCCPCCCGGIQAMVRHGIPMMTSSGYVAHVDVDACAGCGVCQRQCPFQAVHLDDVAGVDENRCMGCGVCEAVCRHHAIHLIREPAKGEPLDVRVMLGEPSEPRQASLKVS
jgi:Pyruvate/2-oxoacid:ferredoxin oxidoreductase delta subunit